MSANDEIRVELSDEANKALGESIASHFEELGIVLVPERLARAAYRLADELKTAYPDTRRGATFTEDIELLADELIHAAAAARARRPGESTR